MKVICTECSALIMPATAKRTRGLCMPCFNGTRRDIDAAIESARRLREADAQPDPARDYWRALVERVHRTAQGFAGLSETEKIFYAASLLAGEVYNGGLYQYFWNYAADHYEYAVLALEKMGATAELDLLRSAGRVLFSNGVIPTECEQRRVILCSVEDGAAGDLQKKRIAALDKQFWRDYLEELYDRIARFAAEHSLFDAGPAAPERENEAEDVTR